VPSKGRIPDDPFSFEAVDLFHRPHRFSVGDLEKKVGHNVGFIFRNEVQYEKNGMNSAFYSSFRPWYA
jgi:hypothetical protein